MNDAEKLQKLRERLKENEWKEINRYQYCLGCGFSRSWNGHGHAKGCWLKEEIDELDELPMRVTRARKLLKEVDVILDRVDKTLDK